MGIFATSTDAQATPAGTGKGLPPELQKSLGKVTEIGSLPEVTTQIVQIVEDPDATARDIRDVVETDPALAAKLLKVVNSAFYGLPSQVASVERAILMLGLNVVKNLALATSLARMIKSGPISGQFTTRDLWRHSVAVGVCARLLARAVKIVQADEAFVTGLVHDMGLIVAQQIFPEKLREVTDQCVQEPQSFCAAEERAIGADHQAFGGVLATRWKFPPGLRHAIAYHHEPSSLQPEFQKITTLIYVADTICCRAQQGYWLTAQAQEIPDWMKELTGIGDAQIEETLAALPPAIEEAERIFSDAT